MSAVCRPTSLPARRVAGLSAHLRTSNACAQGNVTKTAKELDSARHITVGSVVIFKGGGGTSRVCLWTHAIGGTLQLKRTDKR